MMRFKKVYNLKIVFIAAGMLLSNALLYASDTQQSFCLRIPLSTNLEAGVKRLGDAMRAMASSATPILSGDSWLIDKITLKVEDVVCGRKLGPIIEPENIYLEGKVTQYVLNPGVYKDEIKYPGMIFLVPRVVEGVADVSQKAEGEMHISHLGLVVLQETKEGYKRYVLKKPILSPDRDANIIAVEDARIVEIDDKIILQCTEAENEAHYLAFYSMSKDDFERPLRDPEAVSSWKWERRSRISSCGSSKNGNLIKLGDGRYLTYANLYDEPYNNGGIFAFTSSSLDGPWTGPMTIDGLKSRKNPEHKGGDWISSGAPFMPIRINNKNYLFLICNEAYAVDSESKNKVYRPVAVIVDAADPTKVVYRGDKPLFEPDRFSIQQEWVSNVVYVCGARSLSNKKGPLSLNDRILVFYGNNDRDIRWIELDLGKVLNDFSNVPQTSKTITYSI
jgi:predicted GH43/DUF377 family glycosyl hydrolase